MCSGGEDEIYGEFTYAYLNAAVNSDTPCTTNATMTTWYTLYATNKSFFVLFSLVIQLIHLYSHVEYSYSFKGAELKPTNKEEENDNGNRNIRKASTCD